MPDTERYHRWAALLAASDTVLVQLAGLALVAVFAWERLRSAPEPWRGRVRLLYVAVALAFLLVQLVTTRTALVLMLSIMGLSVLARSVWAYRRQRMLHRPLSQPED